MPLLQLQTETRLRTVRWTLILGLAFVMGYFGIDKFRQPELWIGWMPLWIDGLLGLYKDLWLQVIAVLEIVIAILLLVPLRVTQRAGALIAVLHLLGILTQTGWNDIAVRDIGLLAAALALLFAI